MSANSMFDSMMQKNFEIFIDGLWSVFFTYGTPVFLLCAVLSYISAKISARRKAKRKNNYNRRAWRKR